MTPTPESPTSESIRSTLAQALELDLVGPGNEHVFARELLPEPPSRWYPTGFLVPSDAPVEMRTDPTAGDGLEDVVHEWRGMPASEPPCPPAGPRPPFAIRPPCRKKRGFCGKGET